MRRIKSGTFTCGFFSDVLGMCTSADVILPQQTSGQIGMEGKGAEGKLKAMYLLHGMSDDQTIWQRRTSIERYVSQLGIAVVMPTTHLAFYTDTTYGMRYWTYISEELPKICREFFPQMSDKKEDNLAAGLSMGGYGAWKLGLGASETFGAAASLSGCLDIIEDVGRHLEGDSRDAALFRGIYGSLEQLEGSDNDLMALAKKLKTSGKTDSQTLQLVRYGGFPVRGKQESMGIYERAWLRDEAGRIQRRPSVEILGCEDPGCAALVA